MTDKPVTTRKPGRAILFFGLFVIAILALMILFKPALGSIETTMGDCQPQIPSEMEYTVCAHKLSEISASDIVMFEGNADIKFPASAQEIYAYTTGFREMYTAVRFSIKPGEFPAFLKTTLCGESLQTIVPNATQRAGNYGNIPWANPYHAQKLQYCTGASKSASQSIHVDMSDPSTYIIFISDSTN